MEIDGVSQTIGARTDGDTSVTTIRDRETSETGWVFRYIYRDNVFFGGKTVG